MMSARIAIAALLLLSGASSATAQDRTDTLPGKSTAPGQIEPAPRDQNDRPKRGRLIDVIKAVAPQLIEAATSRPPPRDEPVPQPVVLIPPPAPAAATPAPAAVETIVVAPPPPRPRPVQAEPRPAVPRQLPAAVAPRPAPPADRPAPKPSVAPPVEAVAPLPPTPAPPVAEPSLPPPVARTVLPPAPVALETPAPAWNRSLVMLLGIAAAVIVLVGAHRLRRMRQIARTRALLGISPSLDPAAGASSIGGLSLVAPPLSIRARLAPAAHG